MTASILKSTEKTRGRGRPRKDTVAQHFTMEAALSAGIDEWAARQPDQPSRPEAIRRLVEKGLASE